MAYKNDPKIYKVLACDCETSGIARNGTLDPSEGYQMVSLGLVAANADTFEPIAELYVEIKWDKVSKWEYRAEQVHGMSKEYLEKNGLSPEEAAEKIGLFLDEHFGIDHAINLLGQNVVSFDLPFFKKFLDANGLPFKFAQRHMDTLSLSMGTIKGYTSDEIFETLGFEQRKTHHSLEDAKMALRTFKIIQKLWDQFVGVKYEK